MTRARLDGLYLLLLGCVLFILIGSFINHISAGSLVDFKGVYYDARCLLQQLDPYKQGEPLRLYQAEGGAPVLPTDGILPILTLNDYPPATLILITPFAVLPWGIAHLLWMTLTVSGFILGAYLMWDLGASYAPVLSGALIGFCVLNSIDLLGNGNTAGIVVGFCAIAVWCFFKRRFVPAGILCLAVSLAIKPHDAGLIWLYFLLAGGVYRKRALQTLVVTAALTIAGILWVAQVSPHWIQELHANLTTISTHGGINDPGPNTVSTRTASMVIDLQSAVSVFRDDARFYNPVSYLICGALLLAWCVRTLRGRFSQAKDWLALAVIVPLTLLVTYHRPYDARLLLLTVPACAMLWAEGGLRGKFALLATSAGMVMTGDFPLAFLLMLTKNMHPDRMLLSGKMLYILLNRPAPLILLSVCIFYLWVYLRRSTVGAQPLGDLSPACAPRISGEFNT